MAALCQSRLYPPVRDFGFGRRLLEPVEDLVWKREGKLAKFSTRTFTCHSPSYLFYGILVQSGGTSDKDKISYI
jgi:hypothetical protein